MSPPRTRDGADPTRNLGHGPNTQRKKDLKMRTNHLLLALAVTAAMACSKTESKPTGGGETNDNSGTAQTTAAATKIDDKAAKEMFDSRCAACHGTAGKGDGPGAAALNPKPRNYTDKAWQASVTDEQIKKTIVYGGAAVGKSPIMPASPDLDSKPEVVEGLVKIVRSFGK
jgi:mono/diheme cytochrome c family protein